MAKTATKLTLPQIEKTPQMREIEQQFDGKDIRLILLELWGQTESQPQMAEILGVSQGTISLWVKILGMKFVTTLLLKQTA